MSTSEYWNNVYRSKSETEVSWFQEEPVRSLDLIRELNLPASASFIDIGGGESRLVDGLLRLGHENISVLDISSTSLEL